MNLDEKPVMYQTWSDLLFLHWKLPIEQIQKTLPPGLVVDSFDGSAWIGIVPFFMKNIRPRGLFPVPWLSNFQELNVRTYVKDAHGRGGVWFYSLDTNRYIAYKIARIAFNLSYFHAKMSANLKNDLLDYRTIRKGEKSESRFVYGPKNPQRPDPKPAKNGSLDHFLVERYRLFSFNEAKNQFYTGTVEHAPYQIFEAEVPEFDSLAAEWDGFPPLPASPDHICMADPVNVRVFPIEKVD